MDTTYSIPPAKPTVIFQALSWSAKDVEPISGEVNEFKYFIKVFGIDNAGKTVSATIEGYEPSFYIKMEESWNRSTLIAVNNHIRAMFEDRRIKYRAYSAERKDFWGFTNETEFSFMKLSFGSLRDMRSAVSVLSRYRHIRGTNLGLYKFQIYESNIEPFLRFMHIRGIQPCGWISIAKYTLTADTIESISKQDIQCSHKDVKPYVSNDIAPFLVASFDIECTSSGGDFPVPKKDFKHMSSQLYDVYIQMQMDGVSDYDKKETILDCIICAYGAREPTNKRYKISSVHAKVPVQPSSIIELVSMNIDEVCTLLKQKGTKENAVTALSRFMVVKCAFPSLGGDGIIQIGTTFHRYGSKECCYKHVVTLGTCAPVEGADVEECKTEKSLLLKWRELMQRMDPDIVTGYNIFGFDFEYMVVRAKELGIQSEFMKLSRFKGETCDYVEKKLSSSALGDNLLKYIDMGGRVLVDLMKVVMRDHKLDSYKLDNVANHFMGLNKMDVSPQEIFALQKGSAEDRQRIAAYCIQDCALCNYLVMKLEIVANNMGMSNVCLVPMEYIFMRGQGIKIFSLVLNECRQQGYLIPVVKRDASIRKDDIIELITQYHQAKSAKALEASKDADADATPKELPPLPPAGTISKAEDFAKDLAREVKYNIDFDKLKPAAVNALILQEALAHIGFKVEYAMLAKIYIYITSEDFNEAVTAMKKHKSNPPALTTIDDDSYEGAIVLNPEEGIYIDEPVSVLDYASLYPSSMISENLSHDCIVIDPRYDNLPGVEYLDICYDLYEGEGDKKVKAGEKRCRFVQTEKKGVIPNILMKLLAARKSTRKKMAWIEATIGDQSYTGVYDEAASVITTEQGEKVSVPKGTSTKPAFNEFQIAVLDGLQNAYKVTANSLYGQIGAKTSQIYLKDIAACTTATGRKMIMMAKEFLETKYDARIVYGDTDSIFCVFPTASPLPSDVQPQQGHARIMPSICAASAASEEFRKLIKKPHDLEYEKTFWPFILLSKKRYVGNVYERNDKKFKQKSMGIVLKRRDNAQIVKRIYGGIIDTILNKQDVGASIEYLKDCLQKLVNGDSPMEELIISKSLKADYKDPTRIAHKVLAERIAEREPGNAPQVNERIPYVYVCTPPAEDKRKLLQGEKIETPTYIRENGLTPDYGFYITNQIMKPVLQIYALIVETLPGFVHHAGYYREIERNMMRELESESKVADKMSTVREMDVKALLFDPYIEQITKAKVRKSLIAKKYLDATREAKENPVKAVKAVKAVKVKSIKTLTQRELADTTVEDVLAPKVKKAPAKPRVPRVTRVTKQKNVIAFPHSDEEEEAKKVKVKRVRKAKVDLTAVALAAIANSSHSSNSSNASNPPPQVEMGVKEFADAMVNEVLGQLTTKRAKEVAKAVKAAAKAVDGTVKAVKAVKAVNAVKAVKVKAASDDA